MDLAHLNSTHATVADPADGDIVRTWVPRYVYF